VWKRVNEDVPALLPLIRRILGGANKQEDTAERARRQEEV
jgi:hypothetical protein